MGNGIAVCLPSRRAARAANTALTRVGYLAGPARGGHGRDLMVSGWSPVGLEARLTAMRGVLHQLSGDPSRTALTVIGRARAAPASSATPAAGAEILRAAGRQLRSWVHARSGVHAPFPPAVMPAEIGVALRLRATWALEQMISDLAERHLRVAGHALELFSSLRERLGDDLAQEKAIRWAGITFHLSGSAVHDSVIRSATPAPGGAAQRPASLTARRSGRSRVTPAQAIVREFPVPTPAIAATTGTAQLARIHPGRAARPAERPRRRR